MARAPLCLRARLDPAPGRGSTEGDDSPGLASTRIPPAPITSGCVFLSCALPRVLTTVSAGHSFPAFFSYRSISRLSAIGERLRSVTSSVDDSDGASSVITLVTSSVLNRTVNL